MLEISEKEWTKVRKIVTDKNLEIKQLKNMYRSLETDLTTAKNLKGVAYNTNIELEKKIVLLEKALSKSESDVSIVLEKLNETFNIIETYSLRTPSRKKNIITISALDLNT